MSDMLQLVVTCVEAQPTSQAVAIAPQRQADETYQTFVDAFVRREPNLR